ncbi:ABC transporter ATP-binding protein [Macrococcoides caseolyticum]|uniref:ABC transporter ATP-binding protein n=1 Tax=Macrococcoides caseolyticum TaxID=69966 RepID=UPI001F396571|nr:ABC transporter ATP-binding protein [Macrococcus caseolyticus]MCE4958058.1 ABC transporter ATP-binding protein [Macrococcus caseolyticus]
MYVVNTKNLTKKFNKHVAVKDLNICIPKGTICGFLGPNGSGKTTTIRMILGLAKPTSGEINIFNSPINENKEKILNRVGALVDSPSYYEHLSGYENLKIMQLIHNVDEIRIKQVLEIVELTDAGSKRVKDYSLGMKQRLGIAIALIHNPELIILDEPTNGLDPSGIKKIRNLLIELSEKLGISIIVSSHNLFEIEQMCSYVCLIDEGRLLYQGEINSLISQYNNISVYFRTDDNHNAMRLIENFNIKKTGDYIEILNIGDKEIAEINKLFFVNNINIYEIYHKKLSLEGVFLSLTDEERDRA